MSYRFQIGKTFSISRSSSRQILHVAVSFPIFLSVSGSHSSSQDFGDRTIQSLLLLLFLANLCGLLTTRRSMKVRN
ncbi:hypothetical protein ES332_A04G139100v1 [Gossypium tomentosum]|uniref:Uncharacterized protein n=1 Tax=Gossypium tomentosum TaxID=34277 RepID=A0A5D2R1I3_GOSTO|nr:hypothetical protein ES332_A04G139100v1 [Gossypium tomentosum]